MEYKYPVIKEVYLREGTLFDVAFDLVFFAIKTFVFVGVGWYALIATGVLIAEQLPEWCANI